MKAVILCAGEGERMKPLTETTPKPLILINEKPILFYIFNSIPDVVDEVFLVIQEKNKELFEKFLHIFDKDFKCKVHILFQNTEQKGTYFALMAAKDYLKEENKFLVLNGDDIFLKEDIEKLIKIEAPVYGLSHKRLGDRYRTCDIDLDSGKILSFRLQTEEEKNKEVPCFSGAFTLTKDFFTYDPEYVGYEAGIPHTLFRYATSVSFVLLKKWFQINTLEDLEFAKNEYING